MSWFGKQCPSLKFRKVNRFIRSAHRQGKTVKFYANHGGWGVKAYKRRRR
jgi:hypothetical protein